MKRGEHGSYVAPAAADASSPTVATDSQTAGSVENGQAETTGSARDTDRAARRPITDAAAAAKAAYDAKPKVIFRGVHEDVYYRLRAMYKHQLRRPDGIEGWSEFGRHLLRSIVDQYETDHGELAGGEHVQLPTGRRAGH